MEGLVWALKFIISALAHLPEGLAGLLDRGYSKHIDIRELWKEDKTREKDVVASVLGLMPIDGLSKKETKKKEL